LRFFEKDLRIKLTAILLVFIIVATGAALVISYTLITRIIRNNVEGSMGDSARLTSNVVEVGLERRTTRIALLASFPDIRSPATPPDITLATLTLFTRAWPIGLDAVFVDTNGNVVAGTGKLSTIANATRTSWFDNAQSGGISLTYIYNKAELTNAFFATPVLVASSPVRDINNQIFGYVIAFTNVSDITKAVEGVMIETTGHGFVVSGTGVVVAGHVFPPKAKPSSKDGQALSDLVTRMTGGHSGSESVGYAGKGYLVSWTPVEQPEGVASPGLDWTVGVAVPTAEAYAPANDVAMALLLLSVVLLVVGVFAAFFLGRSITRPINELVSNAERVGSGDLTGDVVIRTRDQVGTLAAAFLRMRDYLRSALKEAGFTADKMSSLADEQSAGTQDVFSNTEDIVESVVVLAKNMESQTQKIRKVLEFYQSLPDDVKSLPQAREVEQLLTDSEILAEVGSDKAVEIASAAQDQRSAARDVAAAARRLSGMARELKDMVQRFKV
jgi:methyl-accepting chemotaxis protein